MATTKPYNINIGYTDIIYCNTDHWL